ncbi:MAG TPA: hypothetical protein VKA63_12255 [Candidatus Krumholzibacteria bacterium]|nr:hypothetical protein [Candidatus Krumholzibacteria bacterium]
MRIIISILLLSFLALLMVAVTSPPPSLEIHNRSGVAIRGLKAEVMGSSQEFPGLKAGEDLRVPLKLKQDGQLELAVTFGDGRRSRAEAGYFTPAMAAVKVLTIVSTDSLAVETR